MWQFLPSGQNMAALQYLSLIEQVLYSKSSLSGHLKNKAIL